jgi:ABC-2 type transport system permease protein
MNKPGSLAWFARHELRLTWRDFIAMMTAGRRDREPKILFGFVLFVAFMHGLAFLILARYRNAWANADLPTLISVTAAVLLSGFAMLSQAMEGMTRIFYTRSDLELILSSPIPAQPLFTVRIAAMALSVGLTSVILIGPFIDVAAWLGGARWLAAYGAIVLVSLVATALAVILTVRLFESVGPRRTRPIAQIAAAVIGGAFVIGLQTAAISSTGTLSRGSFLHSDYVMSRVPNIDSVFWWPARAALGEGRPFMVALAVKRCFLCCRNSSLRVALCDLFYRCSWYLQCPPS